MASFLPSSIQKRLLRYVLLQSGLIDPEALSLDSLEVEFGRQNKIELRNVALRVERLSALLSLPPELLIVSAKVLLLRITVPADLYNGAIVADIDGVRCHLALHDLTAAHDTKSKQHRTPHQRKTASTRSPTPVSINPQDLAKSFLDDESATEKSQLRALYNSQHSSRRIDASYVSEASEDADLGTGTALGLPAFLAGFIQGITDRFHATLTDFIATATLPQTCTVPKTLTIDDDTTRLVLRITRVVVGPATAQSHSQGSSRNIDIINLSLDLQDTRASAPPTSTDYIAQPATHHPSNPDTPAPSTPRAFPSRDVTAEEPRQEDIDAGLGDNMLQSLILDPIDIMPGEDSSSWKNRQTRSQHSSTSSQQWQASDLASDISASAVLDDNMMQSNQLPFYSTHTLSARLPVHESIASHHSELSIHSQPELSNSALFLATAKQTAPGAALSASSSGHQDQPFATPTSFHAAVVDLPVMRPKSCELYEVQDHALGPILPISHSGSSSTSSSADLTQSIYQSTYLPAPTTSSSQEDSVIGEAALAEASSPPAELEQRLPGQWNFEESDTESNPSTPTESHSPTLAQSAGEKIEDDEVDLSSLTQILLVDNIVISVAHGSTSVELPASRKVALNDSKGMPGTFSMYAEQGASVRFDSSHLRETTQSLAQSDLDISGSPNFDITVGSVKIDLHPSLFRLAMQISSMMDSSSRNRRPEMAELSRHADEPMSIAVHLTSLHVSLFDASVANADVEDGKPIARCNMGGVHVSRSSSDGSPIDRASAAKLEVCIADERVLSFGRSPQTSVSSLKAQPDPVVSCKVVRSCSDPLDFPVTLLSVDTSSLDINLDLSVLDAQLDSFGGLSGILELSASVLSSGTSSPVIPSSPRKKGVRFKDSTDIPRGPETKINVRIAGLDATVSGTTGAVQLKSSAVKIVNRTEYIALVVDTTTVTAPTRQPTETHSISVTTNGLRVEYLYKPRDSDLERLISLLTPSKNQYDSDDDILLDTLMRQRRAGALLRVNVDSVQSTLTNYDDIHALQSLAEEMSSFSAVAKYLPQDDRPGLLTLLRIRSLTASLPAQPLFDSIVIVCDDVDVAHIPLPSLLATAIGRLAVRQPHQPDLIHGLIPPAATKDAPMLMARIIGDEIEPLLRLKLFNVCLEYSPALLKNVLPASPRVEEVIDLAASSVFDMASSYLHNTSPPEKQDTKKLKIDLLMYECAIGLQPTGNLSKAILSVETGRTTVVIPPAKTFQVLIDIRKAFIHVVDDPSRPNNDTRRLSVDVNRARTLTATVADEGYVTVVSIVNAKVTTTVKEQQGESPALDVVLQKPLVMIDACADSLQTLILVFSGLAPPAPPATGLKYRTDPVPVQDMISSFSGNAFEGGPDSDPGSPTTLFDASDSVTIDHEYLSDNGMTDSIYGGLDALAEELDDTVLPAAQTETPDELAQSLLEDDPYEMPPSHSTDKLSDKDLAKHLQRQFPAVLSQDPIELDAFYMDSDHVNSIDTDSTLLGAPYRWHTPGTHFTLPSNKSAELPFVITVQSLHLIFNLYDGYDWKRTRDAITEAIEEVEAKAVARRAGHLEPREPEDEESLIGDCLFNSIYVGVPGNRDPSELRRQINRGIDDMASESESYATSGITRPSQKSTDQRPPSGHTRRLKLHRSRTHKIAIEVKGLSAHVRVHPSDSGELQNTIDVAVGEVEIFDNVPTSTWRKFMTTYRENTDEREMGKPMIHLEILTLRPVPTLTATELSIKATVMPLRMHVDQDALDFLTRFFAFKDESRQAEESTKDETFIQRIEVNTTHLYLDYKPKRVDYGGLRSGRYTEFKNFFILDKAHIILRHAIVYGVQGFDALHDTLNDVWLPDIQRNQLPSVLGGLAPVSSLVTIGTGLVNVVNIPVQEYKKDGRLMRSIGKGAAHFMRNTTSEVARFGAKVAVGTQNVLQGAETLLSSGDAATVLSRGARRPSAQRAWHEDGDTDEDDDFDTERAVSNYADQPVGVMQGIKSARKHLERDLLTARDALIAVQGEVMESQSASSAASAVARHAPTIILRPVIGASRAVGQTLMGVGNQVDRSNVRRLEDKYKKR